MKIFLHVRDKVIPVECGEGTQKISWLANVGLARYDSSFGRGLGAPKGIQKEGGVLCNPGSRICETLEKDQHVFVLLSDFSAE